MACAVSVSETFAKKLDAKTQQLVVIEQFASVQISSQLPIMKGKNIHAILGHTTDPCSPISSLLQRQRDLGPKS